MKIKPFPGSGPRDSDSTKSSAKVRGESDLILRAQHGDETAFEKLFDAHKRRVYAICLRATRNSADAEDLTQDAFLKVFRGIHSFRGESAFSTWLHRLVMNEVLMHLRKRHRAQPSIEEEFTNLQGEPLKIEFGKADHRLSGCVDRIALNRALAKLPTGYRTAFLLYDVEGYKHSEIARMMNWSVGNSKSQLFKARRKLRAWLRFNPLRKVLHAPAV
jgi:RNA polymerase sigma-70 factor (ECF subfamily)